MGQVHSVPESRFVLCLLPDLGIHSRSGARQDHEVTLSVREAEKDGAEGWVTLAGHQGTVLHNNYSTFDVYVRCAEAALKEMEEAVQTTSKHQEKKTKGMKAAPGVSIQERKRSSSR